MMAMRKRIFRTLRENIGRYLGLFVLIVLAIGMGVGYFEGINSSMSDFNSYLKDNNLEDGLFSVENELDNDIKDDINDLGVNVVDNYYVDRDISVKDDSTLRIFNYRNEIDEPYAVDGTLPENDDEIFIDQLYAKEQELSVGSSIEIEGKGYKVSGIGSFPDYTVSLENLGDMLANRSTFGVAMVTDRTFDKLAGNDVVYNYSYLINDKDMSKEDQKSLGVDILKTLSCTTKITDFNSMNSYFDKLSNASDVKEFTSILNNNRISTVSNKMQTNKTMAAFFVMVVLIIVAFIFSIISVHSINEESAIIGVLRATGVKKSEIRRHYITLPVLITLLGSIVGCILGLTVFYHVPVISMTSYYSMPDMKVVLEPGIIAIGLIVPTVFVFLINYIILTKHLAITPLRLLRHELKKQKSARQSRLTCFKFITRFKIRVILNNKGTYLLLFFGIFLAGWLFMFGLGMSASFDNYTKSMEGAVSEYQYVLTDNTEAENEGDAERATVRGFDAYYSGTKKELSITGYGIKENSKYFKDMPLCKYGEIVVSDSLAKKLGVSVGEDFEVSDTATGKKYSFKIKDIYNYSQGMAIFMNNVQLNNILHKDKDYFNAYFSDKELNIDDTHISSLITKDTLKSGGELMKNAMKSMITMFPILAGIIYVIVMYLMIKMVIDKNESGISMLKVFGFSKKMISKMYIRVTTLVVIASILISIPLQYMTMKSIWSSCIAAINGYFDFAMDVKGYLIIIVTGLIAYLLTNTLNLRRINKISMTVALKENE